MDFQPHGEGCFINPPIVIDGVSYSYAVLFKPAPSTNNDGQEIVSGEIFSATNLGGGEWEIVLKRGFQYSSYTVVIPGYGGTEIEYSCSCGGLFCASKESMRGRSFNNEPMASRGSLESIRAIAGDGAGITQGDKTFICEILSATAYGKEPDEVNYNAEEPTPTVGYVNADINDVSCTTDITPGSFDSYIEGSTIFFETDGVSAPFNSCGIYIVNGGTLTLAERLIYTNPEQTEPDPTYLPPDFGNGVTGAKYWFDPNAKYARLTSSCEGYGDESLIIWYNKNVPIAESIPEACPVVIETISDANGFDVSGDSYSLSGFPVGNDFDVHFLVYQSGFIQWRLGTIATMPVAYLAFDSLGNLSGEVRKTISGSFDTETILDTASYTFPFYTRIVKSAESFSFYAKQLITDSWELKYSDTITGTDPAYGLVGMGRTGVGSSQYSLANTGTITRRLYSVGNAVGNQHVYRFKTVPLLFSNQYPQTSSEPLTEVLNVTAGVAMSASATKARNHYTLEAGTGNIILTSETSGDRVQITNAAPASVPSGPGQALRTYNQPNFSTFQPNPNPDRLATENTGENIANWRDVIRIKIEDSAFVPAVGNTVTAIRGRGVFSNSHPPAFYIDGKNQPTDWTLIDPSNYLVRLYQGLLLLKQSFVETLPSIFCIQALGKRYSNQAAPASSFNELKNSIESFDNLWLDLGRPTGGFGGMHASCLIEFGRTGMEERTFEGGAHGWWISGMAHGLAKITIDQWWERVPDGDPPNYWNDSMPYWWGDKIHDLRLRSGPFPQIDDDEFLTDPPFIVGSPVHEFDMDVIPGEYKIDFDPWRPASVDPTSGTGDQYFGSLSGPDGGGPSAAWGFNIYPTGFNVGDALKRMPDGTVILEAKVRARFEDLQYRSMYSHGYANTATGAFEDYYTTNGYITYWQEHDGTDFIPHEVDELPEGWYYQDNGPVTFSFIAVRINTKTIIDRTGVPYSNPSYDFYAGGPTLTGVSTNVTNGSWAIIDCTDGVKFIQSLLDSPVGYNAFFIMPSVGNPSIGASQDSIAAYLDSLKPVLTSSYTDLFPDGYEYSWSNTQERVQFSTVEFGSLMVRIQLPSGITDTFTLPIIQPPALNL